MLQVKEKYIRLIGIPILALIMQQVMDHDKGDLTFFQNYMISFAFTFVYWNGCYLIFIAFRKLFPSINQTVKRLSFTIVSLIVFILVAGAATRLLLGEITIDQLTDINALLEHKFSALIAAIMVGTIYECVFFFEKWKDTIKQNEALKNQQIRTQFEVLQNQMSPHFLFNSLNTLTTLIAESQGVAIEFTEKLSEVYRYILMNKEKELITLDEELAFSKSYVYLLQMRYPENLMVNIKVDDAALQQHIAPLTIQMLIENCIKHNIISRSQPLIIDIYVDNGKSIVIRNNLQKKKALEKSTKTGLENIRRRYQFLGNKEIDIIVTYDSYLVAIPLIEVVEHQQVYEDTL
ncbi:MAG: histidine kinase [Bacteroidota bacterium]